LKARKGVLLRIEDPFEKYLDETEKKRIEEQKYIKPF